MNDDDGKSEGILLDVDTEVRLDASVPKCIDENIIELDVPDTASLLKTIEGFVQMTSARYSVFIAGRLFHEDGFLQFSVEACTNNVELVNFPVLGSG